MEDLKQIQEFFSKPLNEISKEDAWKKFQKEKSVTDKTIKAARKDFEKEWEAGKLNEVSGDIDLEDFAKVVQAVTQTGHPVTVLLTPMFGKNEIELVIGLDAPDPIGDSMFDVMNDLGYKRGDFSIVGDTSTLSRREYSQIRRVNGGHKDYRRYFEESVNEAEYTDYSNKELATYCKNNPTDKKAAKELHKRSQALKGLTRTDVNEGAVEIMDAFNDVMDLVKKHSRNLSDDDSYAFALKLKAWFNKNIISEEKKLTYNDFVRMVRDDMMAGAAPDERPSEELVGKRAKAYYNDYLQGASVDDLFEATKEEENEFHKELDKLVHKTFGHSSDEKKKMDESSTSEERRIAKRAIRSIAKYRGVSEDEARNDLIRAAKELGSLDEAIKDVFETIKLGKQLNEELCDKGKRYIKARQAAGEKSSAYLSGRAVRVCKGQIEWPKKGKKKK